MKDRNVLQAHSSRQAQSGDLRINVKIGLSERGKIPSDSADRRRTISCQIGVEKQSLNLRNFCNESGEMGSSRM